VDFSEKQFRILLAMRWYRRHLHEGVAAHCREQGWALDSLDHSPDLHHANLWDGIILLHQSVKEFQDLLRKGVPVVTLAMNDRGRFQLPCVCQDQQAIGAMGGRHFMERGFARVLFCGYHDAISHARFQGLRAEAKKHGMSVREISLPHRTPSAAGSEFLSGWLSTRLLQEKPPFAVMTAHDLLGIAVLDACRAAGLKTPKQVAILGVDNEEIICDCSRVSLSSIDNNLFLHGYEAARMLGNLMLGREVAKSPVKIQPRRVITRSSSDTIAARNPRLAQILEHVHEKASDAGMNVKSVSALFGLSRRTLGELFHQARLGPPGQVIREVRLRKACFHLQESSLPVNEVAKICGFASARSFCRFFRQMKGSSPGIWRQSA
jgi:LacI family transcriptional regulator